MDGLIFKKIIVIYINCCVFCCIYYLLDGWMDGWKGVSRERCPLRKRLDCFRGTVPLIDLIDLKRYSHKKWLRLCKWRFCYCIYFRMEKVSVPLSKRVGCFRRTVLLIKVSCKWQARMHRCLCVYVPKQITFRCAIKLWSSGVIDFALNTEILNPDRQISLDLESLLSVWFLLRSLSLLFWIRVVMSRLTLKAHAMNITSIWTKI